MRDRLYRIFTLILIGGSMAAANLEGQWSVDLSVGGASHEAVAAHLDTSSALVALRRSGTPWMHLATGVPLDSGGIRWGSLAGGAEWLSAAIGLRGGGQGYLYSSDGPSDGWGVFAEAGPLLRLEGEGSTLEFSASGITSTTAIDADSETRLMLSSLAQGAFATPVGVAVGLAAQYVRADSGHYPLLAATLSQRVGPGGWWTRFGYWLADEVEKPEWSVGAYLNTGPRLQIHALLRQEANDPIYQRLPRRSWNLGASIALGRVASRAPAAVLIHREAFTIRIPVEGSEPPQLAGDFNDWVPQPMIRDGRFWTATVSAPPGVYRFSFRRNDGTWYLPDTIQHRVDDGFGGENGVVLIP